MRKIGGLILLVSVALTGCSTAVEGSTPTESGPASSQAPSAVAAPLLATPSPTVTLPPAFTDESAKAGYLAGVKKALNAWRDGVIPSDEVLLDGAAQACQQYAAGKTYVEIGAMAGEAELQQANGVAVAVYASRHFCTEYNTDKL